MTLVVDVVARRRRDHPKEKARVIVIVLKPWEYVVRYRILWASMNVIGIGEDESMTRLDEDDERRGNSCKSDHTTSHFHLSTNSSGGRASEDFAQGGSIFGCINSYVLLVMNLTLRSLPPLRRDIHPIHAMVHPPHPINTFRSPIPYVLQSNPIMSSKPLLLLPKYLSMSTDTSKSKIKLPPLRQSSSSSSSSITIMQNNANASGNSQEEIDLVQLKERFNKQLPKYGFLWRSMANARLPTREGIDIGDEGGVVVEKGRKEGSTSKKDIDVVAAKQQRMAAEDKENMAGPSLLSARRQEQPVPTKTNRNASATAVPNLLHAIMTKQPVSLSMSPHLLCGDDCNDNYCADPIIEIDCDDGDEDASVYDADNDTTTNGDNEEDEVELVDTDEEEENEGGDFQSSPTAVATNGITNHKPIINDTTAAAADLENDTDSIHIENYSNETSIHTNASNDDDDDDDDSILILSKTPRKKKKAVIIDSSDEDDNDNEDASDCETLGSESEINESESEELIVDQDDEGNAANANDSFILSDDDGNDNDSEVLSDNDSISLGSADVDSSQDHHLLGRDPSPTSRRTRSSNRLSVQNSTAIPSTQDIHMSNDETITNKDESEEEEWIELSSDEEEEEDAKPQQENTVVILSSDDEEESESDYESDSDGQQSAFTISDDDDSISISDGDTSKASSKNPKRGGRYRSTTGRKSTTRATKPNKNTKPSTNRRSQHSMQPTARPKSTLAFRKNRDQITRQTFTEFNNTAFKGALSSVEVSWSNKLNTTAGITRMRGKLGAENSNTRVATIELATKVIDDEERLRSTLLHEMCHAAQWLVDGVHKPPHGKVFKKWASISMQRTDVEVTTTHDYVIAYKYAWVRLDLDAMYTDTTATA